MTDPLLGRQLANYRIESLIGRGGMASVYFARDVKLDRPVAIKVIDARFRGNPSYTARFLQEARSVAAWRHENIIQVYYADDEDDLYYFAMEYIDGPNLSQILAGLKAQGARMPFDEVLRYGRAVANALDFAHSRNVIHRDVKPANVMVAKDGRIVLGDFGLALDAQQGSFGEVFGTAHYTAPEQARRSNEAVPQSDLYSLGIMLFEMLTGVVPFDDPSPASVALQQIVQPPPSPRQLNPELSAAVEAVLLKALSKQPADRYQTGAELMDALEKAMRPAVVELPTHPVQAETVPALPVPDAARPTNKKLWLYSGLGGCGLFLLGVLVVGGIILFGRRLFLPSAVQLSPTTTEPLSFPTAMEGVFATPIPSPLPASLIPATTSVLSATESATAPAIEATVMPVLVESPTPAAPSEFTPTITLTPKYWNGRKFILFYNPNSFYMYQESGYGSYIAPVAFERLDLSGRPLNRFDGDAWAEYKATTLTGWCMRLEILNAGPYLEPPVCVNRYMASRWPAADDPEIFWTPQEGSTVFRVIWGNEEVGRCLIVDGTCEVYLP